MALESWAAPWSDIFLKMDTLFPFIIELKQKQRLLSRQALHSKTPIVKMTKILEIAKESDILVLMLGFPSDVDDVILILIQDVAEKRTNLKGYEVRCGAH